MPFFGSSRRVEPEPVPEPLPAPTRKHGSIFRRNQPEPAPVVQPAPKKHGIFHRRGSSPSPERLAHSQKGSIHHGGIGSRHSVSSLSSHSSSDGRSHARSHHSGGGSILGRGLGGRRNDPIALAKNRVMAAEKAEIAADRALAVSKKEVLEARDAVERVEKDLRAKQMAVREVSARGRGLGRHG